MRKLLRKHFLVLKLLIKKLDEMQIFENLKQINHDKN